MFDLGESGTGHLLMQPDHVLLDISTCNVAEFKKSPNCMDHMTWNMPILLASTPEFSHVFRPLTTDIAC